MAREDALREAYGMLWRSYRAWRQAIAEEGEDVAVRVWRRARELQGLPADERQEPPSSPQPAAAQGEPPFSNREV